MLPPEPLLSGCPGWGGITARGPGEGSRRPDGGATSAARARRPQAQAQQVPAVQTCSVPFLSKHNCKEKKKSCESKLFTEQ